ncbi:MAG: hypothetical protein OEV94_08300 [Deltaproteobacteria bacterium]|nr:hypothetical protein [Deltaproteobacteria bacterium]
MFAYLISFALENPDQHLAAVVNQIQALGNWGRISTGTFVIHTPEDMETVFDMLVKEIGENDHLYVLPVRRPFLGKGPQELDHWLNEILPY